LLGVHCLNNNRRRFDSCRFSEREVASGWVKNSLLPLVGSFTPVPRWLLGL